MARAKSKSKGAGRPTAYDAKFAEQAKKLCELGATDTDLAQFFEVSDRTIYRWQISHEDFCQALKAGKASADERVERSLYHRACGFEHDAVKIFLPRGSTTPVIVPYREKVAPDTTACIFWLKNRRKDLWRDKLDHEVTGKDGEPIQTDPRDLARSIIDVFRQVNAGNKET